MAKRRQNENEEEAENNVTKKKYGSVEPSNDSAFNKYLKTNSKEKLNLILSKTKNQQKVFSTISSFKINRIAQDIIENPLLPTQSRNCNRNKENLDIAQIKRQLRT